MEGEREGCGRAGWRARAGSWGGGEEREVGVGGWDRAECCYLVWIKFSQFFL